MSSTTGPDAKTTSTPTPSAVAAPPEDAGRGGPPFVEIAGGPCKGISYVFDAGDATYLVSRTQARRAQPGRAELEEVAGLPSPRGSTNRFALHPFILAVDQPRSRKMKPETLDLLGYFLLDPRTKAFSLIETGPYDPPAVFGDDPIALPVPEGTFIITFTHGTKRLPDSGYAVPAGDGTEARMMSRDGKVTPFPSWPNVIFSTVFSRDGVIWAMIVRPRMPGNFVLRMSLAGTTETFAVPGTQRCRGDAQLFPADVVEEGSGAEEVTVEVKESSCVAKGAAGRYRLRTSDARWTKLEGPAPTPARPGAGPVKIGGATLRIEGTRALITGPGAEGERDADPDPPGDPAESRSLEVTAGGREVWLETRWQTRCRLMRYRSW